MWPAPGLQACWQGVVGCADPGQREGQARPTGGQGRLPGAAPPSASGRVWLQGSRGARTASPFGGLPPQPGWERLISRTWLRLDTLGPLRHVPQHFRKVPLGGAHPGAGGSALSSADESPGDVEMQILALRVWAGGGWGRLRACVSNQLPREAHAAEAQTCLSRKD